jgi:hypothetical protein
MEALESIHARQPKVPVWHTVARAAVVVAVGGILLLPMWSPSSVEVAANPPNSSASLFNVSSLMGTSSAEARRTEGDRLASEHGIWLRDAHRHATQVQALPEQF